MKHMFVRGFAAAVPGGTFAGGVFVASILAAGLLGGCTRTREAGETDKEKVEVGYGTREEEDATGSVSSVDADRTQPHRNLQSLIKGRAAGVYVTEGPGGTISIRIRGTTSPGGNNEPLYVIDGVPTNSLLGVNVNDVASIEVLKGAGAAVYGVRGANGVILVTTKRGQQ